MIEYKYEVVDGDTKECDCCGHEAPVAEFDKGPPHREKYKLCLICSSSIISRIAESKGHQDREQATILRAIAQVGNIILDELTGRKP
jgi:hypothetical protein